MKSITALELQENSNPDLALVLVHCNLLRLHLLEGISRELTNPKLGREFVFGNLEDGSTLGFFRKSSLRAVEFARSTLHNSAPLAHTRRAIGELLALQHFPAMARFSYLEPQSKMQQARILGVARGFLQTDAAQNLAIPLAAIAVLELGCE